MSIALLVAYMYLLINSIMLTVEQKDIQNSIQTTHTHLSTLEGEYLNAKESLTKENALSMGFVSITNKTYANRTSYIGQADVQ